MPPKKKTGPSKRDLEDPGDIRSKPAKSKAGTQRETTQDAPDAPNAPEPKTNPGPTTTTAKPRPKPRGKGVAATVKVEDAVTPVTTVPPEPAGKTSKRNKKLSELAQKVQAQEEAEQQVKAQQVKRQAKKDEGTVIQETPEETAAFLEQVKANQLTPTASNVSEPVPTTIKSSKVTTAAKNGKMSSTDRRAVFGQLISSHQPSPEPSVVSGLSVSSSGISSLATR